MNLSPDQIITLKKLISSKGYEEIDVQYEILDHVACRIEVLMDENPKLTLEDAFRKTHSEFGIFGFADLADSYRETIRKKFWRRYWTSLRNLLTSYRVVYLFILGWTFHFLSQNFTLFGERLTAPNWAVIGLMISVILYFIYYHQIGKNYKNYATFRQASDFMGMANIVLQLAIQGIFRLGGEFPKELTFQSILAGVTITALLICWVSMFLLPKIIQEAAADTQRLKELYES
jgi:hypothetical protein